MEDASMDQSTPGVVELLRRLGPGRALEALALAFPSIVRQRCPDCRGTGWNGADFTVCGRCGGAGLVDAGN
jgi:hypothetical protein